MKGWKVEAVVSWPSRVSSTKPIVAASDVFLMSWTRKPTVGGIAMRTACGTMTQRSCSPKPRPSEPPASHWVRGIDCSAPRQISPRKAPA